jgi:phosphoserine aminotransferase
VATHPFNFSAGPAILPPEVFERAADAVRGLPHGLSILEISHRSAEFAEIHERAVELCHGVLGIPRSHAVLFLQGGASQQFAMVPLNLRGLGTFGAYVDTGVWSHKAIRESKTVQSTRVVASSEVTGYDRIPEFDGTDDALGRAAYVHITSNNTIYGTEWSELPDVHPPLVVDCSSHIGSRPLALDRVGLGYAGAQKNLGPSGLTLVFVDRGLLDEVGTDDSVPHIFRYATHVNKGGLYNTPNTFAVLVLGAMLEWLRDHGGVEAMERENAAKADHLYACLDESSLFSARARPGHRSRMNVTWTLSGVPEAEREARTRALVDAAAEAGMVGLRGHRLAGGLRASIYNAFPRAGVDALVELLREFERRG